MELMTKYQYTYFIYPYVIDSKKYETYLLKLLKTKKCHVRIFEKEKDMHLYHYFLPNIREQMFWSFGLTKKGMKSLEELDCNMQATLLAKHPCNIFQYELTKDLQGKLGEGNGIFFDISEIKIVCYETGICFLVFKTILQDSDNFANVLNFNYKFREINSDTYHLKEYENIKIQSDLFKDTKEISAFIQEITGGSSSAKKLNLDNEKFITYSYTCLDQHAWNDEVENESIEQEFKKYRAILPENRQVTDEYQGQSFQIFQNRYARYGFSNNGTVLLTSDIHTENYTILAQKYESEFLYTYLLVLYKRLLLKKLNYGFNETSKFKLVEKQFLSFTKDLWIQEITDDEFGKVLIKNWEDILGVEDIFSKLKNKYDVMYKKFNFEKTEKSNKVLISVISVIIVFTIINFILLFHYFL